LFGGVTIISSLDKNSWRSPQLKSPVQTFSDKVALGGLGKLIFLLPRAEANDLEPREAVL